MPEPLRLKCFRLLPDARIMVGAVKIQQNPRSPGKGVASPFELILHVARYDRKEWIEPAHLLREQLGVASFA